MSRQDEILNKHHCAKCGGAISGEYQTEAYWKAGPNDEPLCMTCGDAVVKAAFDHERAVIEYEREQALLRFRADTLDRLREVLEQGLWVQSLDPDGGDGYQMDGGMWLEGDVFEALFPDRCKLPVVQMLHHADHPANIPPADDAEPETFRALFPDWPASHPHVLVNPPDCPECDGTGREAMPRISSGPSGEPEIHDCAACDGTGYSDPGFGDGCSDEIAALQRAVSALSTAYEMARSAQDKPAAHIISESISTR